MPLSYKSSLYNSRSIWITTEIFLAPSRIWTHRDRESTVISPLLYLQATTAGLPPEGKQGIKSKAGAKKCFKEIKITVPFNEWRNFPFHYFVGDYVTHIIPLMTQPFDFRKRKSVVPRWEELLLFNEDFDYFMSYGTNLVGIFHLHLIINCESLNSSFKSTARQSQAGLLYISTSKWVLHTCCQPSDMP